MSLGITVQHCSVSLIAEDRRFAVGLSSARARRRHADTPTCHATANGARLKHNANETGATVMVAPVVFM